MAFKLEAFQNKYLPPGKTRVDAIVTATADTSCSFDAGGNAVCGSGNPAAEIGLGVAGGVLIAVGIPLLIYGARKVPVGAPTASLPSPLPKWAGAPAGRGWRWEF